jgi:hypothetical protein
MYENEGGVGEIGLQKVIKGIWKGDSGLFSAQLVIKGESVKQAI